jgi:RNA polymerase sigma-70 factor (ECF subfamily)
MTNHPTPQIPAHAAADDADLVRLAIAGDARAFEAIMRRHNRLLFRSARSILRNDAETEDALQETYLRAWRALDTFRAEAKLSTWLVRIAVNEALSRVRRRASNVVLFGTGDFGGVDLDAGETVEARVEAEQDDQPDAAASRAEMRRLMEAHIDRLPEQFRTVFVLRAVEEMSVEETAAALGIPEATVRTRFFRARSHLREGLARDVDMALADAFSFDGSRCDRIVARVLARWRGDSAATSAPAQ